MDRLPNEILHKIFIWVPFQQRLRCLNICRRWYDALHNRSLLHDIEFNDERKFKKFINFIQNKPSHGSQVEILDLQFMTSRKYNFQILCNMFPNLRKIQLEDGLLEGTKQGFFTLMEVPLELFVARDSQLVASRIEEIKDFQYCELTLQLIKTNSCARLTSLELGLFWTKNLGYKLFTYLKNTPALKDLRLNDCEMEIEDCEVLHKNTPMLENFGLLLLKPINCELPRNIIPATSIKSFSIQIGDVDSDVNYSNWYLYFAKKYTNLAHFDYLDEQIANVDANQAMTIYREGILPLFKNVKRKQLNAFHADNVPIELDLFNKLSVSGFRFESFDFNNNYNRPIFTQLAESDLSKYVKHIKLIQTTCNSPILFQNFTSLKSLEIYADDFDINLTDCLNTFSPTLTSFEIHCKELEISKPPTRSCNIEELQIRCNTITPKLCNVISNYLPKLNRIFLQGLLTENLSINLPNNHFSVINIETGFSGDLPHGFSVTNKENVQSQYFVGEKPKNKNGYSFLVPATLNDLQDRVVMNIKYETADQTYYYTYDMSF